MLIYCTVYVEMLRSLKVQVLCCMHSADYMFFNTCIKVPCLYFAAIYYEVH